MRGIILALAVLTLGTFGAFALDSSEIRNEHDAKPAAKQFEDPREAVARVPAFVTDSRIDKLMYYPCDNCHLDMVKPNPNVRELEAMHVEIKLNHGGGRYWCLTCHDTYNRNFLTSLKQQPISFDEPHLLCGQCHFARQKDFFYGGHGKRKDNWKGHKRLTNCTECHNPHNPAIKAREPRTKPTARMGLEIKPTEVHSTLPVWKKHDAKQEH